MGEPGTIPWPKVLAVVVTHNGRRWLPGCLKSLSLQSYPAIDVVVVDNASTDADEVPRLVGRLLAEASVMRFERNVGYGAAANRALEVVPEAREAEYFLFIHDDVALDPDCVGLLVASALETEAGVVGGKGLSWDEPEVLLEVGMSADEFGYPVSGLEEGEIDQGQHDTRREVLFVTSACILVSRATVERGGAWDPSYFLFGEDLDLCIRARMLGFPVVVAPKARFYHAVAMATGRREDPPAESVRYFTRRNRLRTIAKNASAARVLLLLALYTGVLGAETVLLAALRRFSEIPPYFRAYGWFVRTLPDVARRRRAVQRRRKVPDRRVRRYMVRDLPRARIFLERRLMQWGEETLRRSAKTFAHLTPAALVARLGRWARSPSVISSVAVAVVLAIACRHVLLGAPVGAGTLWPFPTETHRLLTDYLARWREVGLGTTGAPAPVLPVLWLVAIASFGNAALAQHLLVALTLAIGLVGVNRFVKRRTAFAAARIVAVGVYALAPVVRLAMVTGDLGALALYAAAPFLLEMGLRTLGPAPGAAPPGTPGGGVRAPLPATTDALARQAVRLGLLSALVVALAPSALMAVLAVWALAGVRAMTEARTPLDPARRLRWLLGSAALAVVLLLPWSLEALRTHGAILGPLFAGPGGGARLHPLWSSATFAHALLLSPGVSALAGAAAVAIVAGALFAASTSRRREVRLLAAVIGAFGLWAGLVAKGWLPAPVVSPALWLVFPLLSLAVCAGYLLAGLAQDLTRHAAGLRHSFAVAAAVAAGVALAGGWVPTLLSWGAPPDSAVTGTGAQSAALAAVGATAPAVGPFRVLWLGEGFVDPVQAGVRVTGGVPYLVTGPEGLSMLDAAPPSQGAAGAWLADAVADLVAGRTHLAGHLLATAGIRFVVVNHADPAATGAILLQRDLALEQQVPGQADLYLNLEALPIAGVAPTALEPAAHGPGGDLPPLLMAQWPQAGTTPAAGAVASIGRQDQGSFRGSLAAAASDRTLLLGEAFSPGWHATVGLEPLRHDPAFGWANRFTVPAGASGVVRIGYSGEWIRLVWVAVQAALVALALAMAFIARAPGGGRREPAQAAASAPPETEKARRLAGSGVRMLHGRLPTQLPRRGGP